MGIGVASPSGPAGLEALLAFFGPALDEAGDILHMLNPWAANSLAGSINGTVYYALGTALSGVTSFATNLPGRGDLLQSAGKYAKWGGYSLAISATGLGQYLKDEAKPGDMPLDRQISRAVGQAITVGGAAIVGGFAGSKLGAAGGGALGAVVGDGGGAVPGIIAGNVVGGLGGAIGAAKLVDHVNDSTVAAFGDAGVWANDEIHRFPHQVAGAEHYVEHRYTEAYHNAQGIYQDIKHSPQYQDAKETAEVTYGYLKQRATEDLHQLQHVNAQLRETLLHPDFGAVLDDLNPLPGN